MTLDGVQVYGTSHLLGFSSVLPLDISAVSSFNDTQMPFYMRWDNSVSAEIRKGRHRHNISVGVYNTLNRHNPSMVIYNDKSERWQTLSLIPIMPSLNYKFEF